jgi:hypothetical protein
MELEIIMLNQAQKDKGHVFLLMWKLDLSDKFIYKYINDLIYICTKRQKESTKEHNYNSGSV